MLRRILFVALLVGISAVGTHTASDAGKGKDKFIQKRQEREREKNERDKQQESERELEGNEGDEHKSTGENCLIPPAPEPEPTTESK